jgi:hypothetical protein
LQNETFGDFDRSTLPAGRRLAGEIAGRRPGCIGSQPWNIQNGDRGGTSAA